jgi:DNA-binding CsgD family transcriptional regulator
MTERRDSSGGYLTGDEAERLWDADQDDGYDEAEDIDEDDDEPDRPLPSIWARARAVDAEIQSTLDAIGRTTVPHVFDPGELSPADLDRRVELLESERAELEFEMEIRGFPPPGWRSPEVDVVEPTADVLVAENPRPVRSPAEVLRPALTASEYEHWEWLEAGEPQSTIADRLGISQAAVSKRERTLRDRVDAIYRERTGAAYHWILAPRRVGGRRRRR